jgi:uncharacterized pyridoxal phosphate-containing UPF0001 family protein
MEAYKDRTANFGENKIQEMAEKWEQMPKDITPAHRTCTNKQSKKIYGLLYN